MNQVQIKLHLVAYAKDGATWFTLSLGFITPETSLNWSMVALGGICISVANWIQQTAHGRHCPANTAVPRSNFITKYAHFLAQTHKRSCSNAGIHGHLLNRVT
jgi:hypothetical protein